MRRIIVNNAQANEPSLIEELASEYRAFKAKNPKRTARVPLDIKLKARDVRAGGSTVDEIARAVGISRTAVDIWLKKIDQQNRVGQKKAVAKKAQQALELVPASKSQAPLPLPVPLSSIEQDWVRIRIDGREIDVAKKDFWMLLQSK